MLHEILREIIYRPASIEAVIFSSELSGSNSWVATFQWGYPVKEKLVTYCKPKQVPFDPSQRERLWIAWKHHDEDGKTDSSPYLVFKVSVQLLSNNLSCALVDRSSHDVPFELVQTLLYLSQSCVCFLHCCLQAQSPMCVRVSAGACILLRWTSVGFTRTRKPVFFSSLSCDKDFDKSVHWPCNCQRPFPILLSAFLFLHETLRFPSEQCHIFALTIISEFCPCCYSAIWNVSAPCAPLQWGHANSGMVWLLRFPWKTLADDRHRHPCVPLFWNILRTSVSRCPEFHWLAWNNTPQKKDFKETGNQMVVKRPCTQNVTKNCWVSQIESRLWTCTGFRTHNVSSRSS